MEDMDLLEQAERQQEGAMGKFLSGLKTVARTYWNKLTDLIDLQKPSEAVSAEQARQSNWRAVTRYRLQLRPLLGESGYDDQVSELMENMKQVTLRIESYYEPAGLSTQGGMFERAAREAMERVRVQLLDTLPEVAFINPVEEALQNAVLRGSSMSQVQKELRERLVDSGLPTRYVHQQAGDALWTYHRNYSGSVGKALGLDNYFYDGVIVGNSRPFCTVRTGKVYTQQEIEAWALLDWQGKIPGTTKESIFYYCGGYNCRHVLRPITRKLYERLLKEQTNEDN